MPTAVFRAAFDRLPRASAGLWTLAAFASIVALAAALRLYALGDGHPGLAIYTSISSNMARSPGAWLYPSMLADGSILADKPPVFFWLQGAFFALFGTANLVARLPSALAGVASVILLYLIIRRCHGVKPALISAAALAVMPLDVNYSRSTFIEPVAVFFMMSAAYFAVRAVHERRAGFFYATAFVLGIAFLAKLWQGLLPAPAIAALALGCRWTSWGRFIRIAAISAAVFLATALWWPLLVWLAPAYDSVMHADNVWDMIFGWNLTQRFGALEYGANHRRDILWFLTGPMSLFLGVSLLPSAAIGAASLAADEWTTARTEAARAFARLRARFPVLPDVAAAIAPRRSPFAPDVDAREALPYRPSVGVGLLWTVWALAAVIAFGGTSVRLATYWTAAAPAFAALTGIGIASLAPRLRWRDGMAWVLTGVALAGVVYCAGAYGSASLVAPHFRQASLLCWALAAVVAVAAVLMYFELRAFGGRLPAWTITAACAAAALASCVVVFHNITQPRDDTLGRIGFDMIAVPAPPPQPPPETLGERRAQLQGALITAIVRTDTDDLTSALDYVRRRREGGRYLLAADTYNTAAMVTFLTGEPVLPLYSEYRMSPLLDERELRRVFEDGETRFILTADHMRTMDWRIYALIRSSATEVTSVAGLPRRGEMRLFRVRERR